jgi:hypothetical protein
VEDNPAIGELEMTVLSRLGTPPITIKQAMLAKIPFIDGHSLSRREDMQLLLLP